MVSTVYMCVRVCVYGALANRHAPLSSLVPPPPPGGKVNADDAAWMVNDRSTRSRRRSCARRRRSWEEAFYHSRSYSFCDRRHVTPRLLRSHSVWRYTFNNVVRRDSSRPGFWCTGGFVRSESSWGAPAPRRCWQGGIPRYIQWTHFGAAKVRTKVRIAVHPWDTSSPIASRNVDSRPIRCSIGRVLFLLQYSPSRRTELHPFAHSTRGIERVGVDHGRAETRRHQVRGGVLLANVSNAS
jgi:hypothetical protein